MQQEKQQDKLSPMVRKIENIIKNGARVIRFDSSILTEKDIDFIQNRFKFSDYDCIGGKDAIFIYRKAAS